MERYDHGGDIFSQKVELDFSVNVNPLGMPAAVREAVIADVDRYVSYPDPKCRALCAALARAEGCPASQVLCGSGAADLIIRLCLARRPRRVLICAPTFSEYEKAALMSGAQVEQHLLYEADNFDLGESILGRLTPGLDMVFLCNPNNPTGCLTDRALLERIAGICRQKCILLVIDECFLSFTGEPSCKPMIAGNPSLVIVDAFTKLYAMAGLRLGFMLCSDEELLKQVSAFGQSWSVSTPAQTAGLAALECGRAWIERTRAACGEERAFMSAGLAALGLKVFPGAANYVLFKSAKPLAKPLLERGILIRSCANYTGLDENFYRIGVKSRQKNQRLLAALEEVVHNS